MPASRYTQPIPSVEDEYSSSTHPSDADDELTETSEDMSDDGTWMDLNDRVEALTLGKRGASPTPSVTHSVYSYRSSVDGTALLKDVHGRVLNNMSDTYALPADVLEHSRLDMQHEMLKKFQNGLFFAPEDVRRALAPRPETEPQPSVLDIGSGSGSWLVDMAKMFPHAEVLGIDLAPANLTELPPSNCRFECDDVNLGISHYREAFDVVHVSCVAQGITDFRKLMDEIVDSLRPGGVFLAIDGDLLLWDENEKLLPLVGEGEPGFSWTLRFIYAVRDAMRARAPGVDDYVNIYDWLEEQGNIWEKKGKERLFALLGPWKEDATPKERYIATIMQRNFCRVVDAFRPLLLSSGFFLETVDKLTTNVKDEVENMKFKHQIRWSFEWAVKARGPRSP